MMIGFSLMLFIDEVFKIVEKRHEERNMVKQSYAEKKDDDFKEK